MSGHIKQAHFPRRLLASFVNDVVGERLTPTQLQAAEALQKVFAEQVETTGGTEVGARLTYYCTYLFFPAFVFQRV